MQRLPRTVHRVRRLPLLLLAAAPWLNGKIATAAPPARTLLPQALAAPLASDLTAATHADVVAWIENAGGAWSVRMRDASGREHVLRPPQDDDGRTLSELALSPKGTCVAYVADSDADFPDAPAPNAANRATPPTQTLHLIARGTDRGIGQGHNPSFSPDDRHLAFSAGGNLFVAETETGGARQVATIQGHIGRIVWSPDGARMAFSIDRDDHALIGLYSLQDRRLVLPPAGFGFDIEPMFSPDGHALAFLRLVSPPDDAGFQEPGRYWSVHIRDLETLEDRTIWTPPPGAGAIFQPTEHGHPSWEPEGLILPWEGSGWLDLYRLTTSGAMIPLTPGAFEVQGFAFDPSRRAVLYSANTDDPDRRALWRVSLADGRREKLASPDGALSSPVMAPRDIIAAIATDGCTAPHIVTLPLPTATAACADAPRDITFKAADGMTLHGQLFLPPEKAGRHAALVFVHGGPNRQMLPGFGTMAYYDHAYEMNRLFARQGYVVLSVNYRSGTGYGVAFRRAAAQGRRGASEYRDVLAAAETLRRRADVDPKRLGIWGGSWGGFLVGLSLARNSDIFAAGADFHGVHDMVGFPAPGLSPADRRAEIAVQWASSPIADVRTWRSPVLIVQGDDDLDVSFSQSVLLDQLLTARDIPHDVLSLPGERHGFLRQKSWETAYGTMDQFFARQLHPDHVLAEKGTP